MKALTLWQPFASLVALGVKTIETRSWSTSYRGPLAIHAAARKPEVPDRYGWIGQFNLGRWADPVVHSDPCDCDFDEEQAGKRCMANSDWEHALFNDEGAHGFSLATVVPVGAVIATCTLVGVVPMVDGHGRGPDAGGPPVLICTRYPMRGPEWDRTLQLVHHEKGGDITNQLPYGDYTPGRFAWLLDDIKPVDPPVSVRGHQQLWEWAR